MNIWKIIFIGVVIIAVLAGLLIWHKYYPQTAEYASYLIGGTFLLFQVFAYSKRANAAEKTANLTEKGNTTERFNNAIEHLGHESDSVRLGGIYALHHIAKEAEDYRGRVCEILCAYIRTTTNQKGYKPETISQLGTNAPIVTEPNIQVKSILDLLFIRTPDYEIYQRSQVNLMYTGLKYAKLENANLQNADLQFAQLQFSELTNTNLQNANLTRCDLQVANFSGSNLQNATFIFANLEKARNLTIDQLLKAKTLYRIKLPDGMEAKIRDLKPELLKKPEPENEQKI